MFIHHLQLNYIQPLVAISLIIFLAAWIRVRMRKGSRLLAVALIFLFLISWPPVDWLLSRPLEYRYPARLFNAPGEAQAIIVLSSSVEAPAFERPYPRPDLQTYQRCDFAAWLHHRLPSLPVLVCGGRGGKGREPYARTMGRLLERAGVPPESIWTEESSRSTYENAVFGARILHLHGLKSAILVVDARSMPRAAACFRKQGINVIPAPSYFREFGPLDDELLPSWRAIQENEVTLHESLALGWYWLRGWI